MATKAKGNGILLLPSEVRADALVVRQPINGKRRFTARDALTTVDLVHGAPWQPPPRSRHQRGRSGVYFFASTRRHVGYASLQEESLLLALDHSQSVAAVLAQPFKLFFRRGDEKKDHVPDFFAVHHDGAQNIWEVRPLELIDVDLAREAALTREFCRDVGFGYFAFDGMRTVTKKTLLFLHAYSDPRRYAPPPKMRDALLEQFASPSSMRAAVESLREPPWVTRMWVYHLMWTRQLDFDHSRALSDSRPMHTVGGA
ncbi:TnsA-like heteromeric transposase endonuclease subunit [Microbacterium maritypicum]|uniref:TnsA-like heteromeric transposase endonuclease subunit n=1 Tax=Microbacterium maritypicum TaxID=33918 RepID=UPI001B31F46A|nr:TnsA-like heteromeric transposase endonuclease subunit [Microbacterium liquefaciens]MBP5801276.1 TnsA-like heteromeric transposase endonuclease subunit [Microbacterium liquefaciens]